MPRAPFDENFEFVCGPDSPTPGDIHFSGPGRFIAADAISQQGVGAPLISGWVTTDSGIPTPSWVSTKFGVKASLADQVAIGGSPLSHWVVYTERVDWHGPVYYRASIAELPLPDSCSCSDVPTGCVPVGSCCLPRTLVYDASNSDPVVLTYDDSLGRWTNGTVSFYYLSGHYYIDAPGHTGEEAYTISACHHWQTGYFGYAVDLYAS